MTLIFFCRRITTKDWAARTPLQTGKPCCSGRENSSCSISVTRCISGKQEYHTMQIIYRYLYHKIKHELATKKIKKKGVAMWIINTKLYILTEIRSRIAYKWQFIDISSCGLVLWSVSLLELLINSDHWVKFKVPIKTVGGIKGISSCGIDLWSVSYSRYSYIVIIESSLNINNGGGFANKS